MNLFNEDYYEHGTSKGISLYENYRWLPERSLYEAHWFVEHMGVKIEHTTIDYGCAKGYFVKAMKILGYDCYGYDISEYAILNCDPQVCGYVFNNLNRKFNFGYCKDVLEHCEPDLLPENISAMGAMAPTWLIIVPLASNGVYIEPNCNRDITHKIFYTEKEWLEVLSNNGFKILSAKNTLRGFKEHWKEPKGNLFAVVSTL